MNPLDLSGPEFLAFYLVYGVGVLALAWTIRLFLLSSGAAFGGDLRWRPGVYPREEDAYAIALLRGGPQEVVRAVLGSLASAGLVRVEGPTLQPAREGPLPRLSPIESTAFGALSAASGGIDAADAESTVRRAVEPDLAALQEELGRHGLTLSETQARRFRQLRLLALLALLGIAAAKLAVALGRGRANVGFLVLMAAGFAVAAFFLLRPPERARAAARYLDWLRESHRGLVDQLSRGPQAGGAETALAAAIYGLQVLPVAGLLTATLRPREAAGESGYGIGFVSGDVSMGHGSGEIGGDSGGDSGGGDSGGGDSGGGDGGGGDGGGGDGGGCGGGCGGCGGS